MFPFAALTTLSAKTGFRPLRPIGRPSRGPETASPSDLNRPMNAKAARFSVPRTVYGRSRTSVALRFARTVPKRLATQHGRARLTVNLDRARVWRTEHHMAARKPAAKKKTPSPTSRMRALALTLGNISDLFGGSEVTLGPNNGFGPNTLLTLLGDPRPMEVLMKEGIHIKIRGFGTRVYRMKGSDLIVTADYGTPKHPDIVTERAYIEEPIAFLLEYTSPNDNFKDTYENIMAFTERELR